MKKGSRTLIAKIYEVDESSSQTILDETIRHAIMQYNDDEYQSKVEQYFKEHIKDWRFIREAQIKAVDWTEVWEHFKDPNEEAGREQFLKDWKEFKIQQKARDNKANQKIVDLIQESMIKEIRSIAGVDSSEGSWQMADMFKFGLGHFKEKIEFHFGYIMGQNDIKNVKWEALYDFFLEQLEEVIKEQN